ncbi:hypothetical protein EJB05_24625, partial [Eragrostis curvula]
IIRPPSAWVCSQRSSRATSRPTAATSGPKRSGNGQPKGRFSNGRLAVDFISEAFGLPPLVPPYLDPNANISSLATGACFASAGAGYDNATSDLFVSHRTHIDHATFDAGLTMPRSSSSLLCFAVGAFNLERAGLLQGVHGKLRSFYGEDKARETLSEALYIQWRIQDFFAGSIAEKYSMR